MFWCLFIEFPAHCGVPCRFVYADGGKDTEIVQQWETAEQAAYGFSAKNGLLTRLLELNLSVAQRLEKGKLVTPPGILAQSHAGANAEG